MEQQNGVSLEGLKIALAGMADMEDMVKIHCAAWRQAYEGIISDDFIERKNRSRRDKWQNILKGENKKHYLVKENGKAVGMVSIDLPRGEAEPGVYEVFGLYILPEYSRMGYGSAIMTWVENTIRTMGYEKISLWVLEPNLPARRFYEKLGFSPDGTEMLSYYDKPIKLLRYVKCL